MGMTTVEKILAHASGRESVRVGDVVEPRVDLAMSHENAALVLNQFNEIYKDTGLTPRIWDPDRVAIIFDHRVPAESAKTASNQKRVREFVAQQGIRKFHDIRGDEGGICHQILPENGYVRPGCCGRGHGQSHDQSRCPGRIRIRSGRHRDGLHLGAGPGAECRSSRQHQGHRARQVPDGRAAQGPDPVSHRPADGRRRQLQGDRVPRRGH